MQRGAKRSAVSFDPVAESGPQSKRVMDAPSFNVHRVESSHQHLMAGPPLDPYRVESAHQHVKSLNSQFASWVQLQLQNHPDELWEDGVSDYLSHASSIMEKFKDVVDWLRENKGKQQSVSFDQKNLDAQTIKDERYFNPSLGSAKQHVRTSFPSLQNSSTQNCGLFSSSPTPDIADSTGQKSLVTARENSKASQQPEVTNGIAKQVTQASFSDFYGSTMTITSVFSFSQKPAFSGNQTDTSAKVEGFADVDEADEMEKPSSPSLQKVEEKGILVVHEAKCKVYVKPDDPSDKGWKDIGMGHLSIKCKEGADKATKDSRPTIIIRDDVGKILLNALIYRGIKMNIQKNTIASIFHSTDERRGARARTYLMKLKNEEETTKLAAAIKNYTPTE